MNMDSHSLQVWPRGTSYVYVGNPDDPQARRLRARNERRLRKGRKAEWDAIQIELRAEMYLDRDILACQSSLVDELLKSNVEGFSYDDLENVYVNPAEWSIEQCREWLGDHSIDHPLTDEADDEEVWRGVVSDNATDHAAEVMEWWLVTDWLCEQLKSIGEVIIDNGYGHWWGRQGTGQALIMDGTLQQIAKNFYHR